MPLPYKTELVNANGFYTALFGHSTRKYKHEDIIIAYAVWNSSMKSSSCKRLSFVGLTGGGKSQVRF